MMRITFTNQTDASAVIHMNICPIYVVFYAQSARVLCMNDQRKKMKEINNVFIFM